MTGILATLIGQVFSGSAVTADPYFEYTTLLLPGNGTNGAQNNTFLDGSTNNFTITRNGNTTQGTFSPFSQTGWGNYFGSSTSNLKFATDAGFAIGAGNFSIECFVNLTAWSGNQRVCIQGQSGTTNIQIAKDSASNDLFVDIQGTRVITYAWTPSVGQWYHIALVRSGTGTNQVTLYIDGSSVATGTSSASIAQNQFLIGGLDWASSYNIQGYISNFRYSNVARTITVPTSPYTSDANTLILTCQSNRFVDNSASPKTITVNGTTSVVAFSPFNPTASWSAATYGGSGYFDGNGDYLTVADSTSFDLPSDYTIELWFYPNVTGGLQRLFMIGDYRATYNGIDLYVNASNQVVFYSNGASIITGGTVTNFQWNHVALVRNGSGANNTTLYVNGSSAGQATNTTSFTGVAANGVSIGLEYSGAGTSTTTATYVSDARLVKGTAVYTGNFTPPTAPITNAGSTSAASYPSTTNVNTSFASSATSLLLNFTNAGIYDATSKNDLETVGNAQISTTQSKWGGSSMYFNATNPQHLLLNYPTSQNALNGAFTIDFWIYWTSGTGVILSSDEYSSLITILSTGKIEINTATSPQSTGTIPSNTWTYLAFTRNSSGVWTLYINGSADALSLTNTATYTLRRIGGRSSDNCINGYLQDFRVTKGYVRPITTPTAAFPTL